MPFVLGSGRRRRPPPFGILMLRGGKATPEPRFWPAVKTLVRRKSAVPPCGAPGLVQVSFLGFVPVGRLPLRHLNTRGRQSCPCTILRRRPEGRLILLRHLHLFDQHRAARRKRHIVCDEFLPFRMTLIANSLKLFLPSDRDPERSRWRLCRLTDAAYPLRALCWAHGRAPPYGQLFVPYWGLHLLGQPQSNRGKRDLACPDFFTALTPLLLLVKPGPLRCAPV